MAYTINRLGRFVPITTRDSLRNVINTFDMKLLNEREIKKLIKIYDRDFSDAFKNIIGLNNYINVSEIDDKVLCFEIFSYIVEEEAKTQILLNRNDILESMKKIEDNAFFSHMYVDGKKITWNAYNEKRSDSLIEYVKRIFSLSEPDSVATLANIVHMKYENIFHMSSDKHSATTKAESHVKPSRYVNGVIKTSKSEFNLISWEWIYGFRKQYLGAVLQYSDGKQSFCLPATVSRGEIAVGRVKPTAFWYNQHLLDSKRCATVLLFEDMRTAIKMQKILDTIQSDLSEKYVITSHLGNDLTVLSWNFLFGHDVIYIPSPTKIGMAKANAYDKQVSPASRASFKVYKGLLLRDKLRHGLESIDSGSFSPAEKDLLLQAYSLDDEVAKYPVALIEKIIENSVKIDDYVKWGKEYNIFRNNKVNDKSDYASEKIGINSKIETSPIMHPIRATTLNSVNAFHIFCPGTNVLIEGIKNAGKTQISMSCARDILLGNKVFGVFDCPETSIQTKLLYVDGETPYDEVQTNVEQYGLSNLLGKRFFMLSKFDDNLPESFQDFELSNESFRNALIDFVLKNRIHYVILDNLYSLLGDLIKQSKYVDILIKFLEILQKKGVCVIIVHHTVDGYSRSLWLTRPSGSQTIARRARAEIILIGSNEYLQYHKQDARITAAANNPGLTVGVAFKSVKNAPVLEKTIYWLHKQLGCSELKLIKAVDLCGNSIDLPYKNNEITSNKAESLENIINNDVTYEEHRVLEYAKMVNGISNSDIKMILNCQDTKAQDVRKSLVQKGLLISNEKKGPAIRYLVK